MIKSSTITGLGCAMSPVVHNEVQAYGYNEKKGDANKQRMIPMLLDSEGKLMREMVPCVSGNALRGLGRRLLVDYSLDELDIYLKDLVNNNEEAKRLLYFFRNGGLTPKDVKPDKVEVGTYEKIQKKIPFLLALGGVYQGHHFEGCVNIGFSIPMTKETYPFYKNSMSKKHREKLESVDLPHLKDISGVIRYTRRAGNEPLEEKESMIYGTEVIPAGTYFFTTNSVASPYECGLLTFRAMFWLIKEYGCLGGMSGRGHGSILYDFKIAENGNERSLCEDDYKEYVAYLKEHKEEIKEAIKMIPECLPRKVK